MRVDLLSREYPPEVYGGAGVHVAELVRALRRDLDVVVRAFGAPRDEEGVFSYGTPAELSGANGALRTMGTDLLIARDVEGADLVHSHTWYANFAGHVAKMLHGIPHVVTAHSLEPLRPWKAEQLGGGYRLSSWIEREALTSADAVVAVSEGMRRDLLRVYPELEPERVKVVYNGIDLDGWQRVDDPDTVRALGVDPDRPSIVFVGRITRQKGLPYLLRAARALPPEVQLVLCAGAPDTAEIMAEVEGLVAELRAERDGVVWIDRHLPRPELCALLSAATTFVCPSVYEPLGIVNLEAMACGAPVVGTGTGGIPEVVADGVTGAIVPIEQVDDGTGTPIDPERFVGDLAAALTEMVSDPDRARALGAAGRERAEREFSWTAIADRTRALYADVRGV
ncbi:glycogen synthase [Microbacterium barkeri]|uniref:Glycogen synthase n=1 Tax=Microbacterium barkeri TaxID=33917 RepID=A0A9W6LXS9_9MICO|nr:glycogen synthase [Microbacterium barkeri]MDR6876835.1 starch synthase [Microbacterium barkeri]GLJ62816.1 glycogen synthase [Microbacterium barkeri]